MRLAWNQGLTLQGLHLWRGLGGGDRGGSLEAGAECRLRGGSVGLAGQGRGEWLSRPREQAIEASGQSGPGGAGGGQGPCLARGSRWARVGPELGGGGAAPRPGRTRAEAAAAEKGCGKTNLGRVGTADPGPAGLKLRCSMLLTAVALAQAASSARPPSCSGSPRGALPRRGARSRALARRGRGAFPRGRKELRGMEGGRGRRRERGPPGSDSQRYGQAR